MVVRCGKIKKVGARIKYTVQPADSHAGRVWRVWRVWIGNSKVDGRTKDRRPEEGHAKSQLKSGAGAVSRAQG